MRKPHTAKSCGKPEGAAGGSGREEGGPSPLRPEEGKSPAPREPGRVFFPYRLRGDRSLRQHLISACKRAEAEAPPETVRSYTCVWFYTFVVIRLDEVDTTPAFILL